MENKFDHVWFWRARLPDRKGERCAVLVRGTKNNILVEFDDGFKVITSRYAVRRRQESFTGQDAGCAYCDLEPDAIKKGFCEKGKKHNYKKCGE